MRPTEFAGVLTYYRQAPLELPRTWRSPRAPVVDQGRTEGNSKCTLVEASGSNNVMRGRSSTRCIVWYNPPITKATRPVCPPPSSKERIQTPDPGWVNGNIQILILTNRRRIVFLKDNSSPPIWLPSVKCESHGNVSKRCSVRWRQATISAVENRSKMKEKNAS